MAHEQRTSTSRSLWAVVGLVALLLLIFIFIVGLDPLLTLLRTAHWGLLSAGTLLFVLGSIIGIARWRYLLENEASYLETVSAEGLANMLALLLPLPVAGIRTVSTGWVTSVSVAHAASSMVLERLPDIIMRLIAAMVAYNLLAVDPERTFQTVLMQLVTLSLLIVGLVLATRHRIRVAPILAHWLGRLPLLNEAQVNDKIMQFLEGLAKRGSPRQVGLSILLLLAGWSCFLGFQLLAVIAVPVEISITEAVALSCVALAVVPPSMTLMVGLYHLLLVATYTLFRLTDLTTATAYAVVAHLPQTIFWLVLGLWALRRTQVDVGELIRFVRQPAETDSSSESEQTE